LSEHIRSGKLDKLTSVTVNAIDGGKPLRELFELGRINAIGIENLANKVFPISAARLPAILKLAGLG